MPKTVRFYTLGCKVNQYDSEAMLEAFLRHGYVLAPRGKPADVTVVNTCTVTGTGDKKSLQAARRFRRQNPAGELVLAGCLAQRLGKELLDTGARLIIGTQHRARVVELLERAVADDTRLVAVDGLQGAPFEPLSICAHAGHTRAVMKIQEGCDNRCAYCIIPSVRGGIRSRPVEAVRAEAQALADAVRAVHGVAGVKRIRLGSLEPAVVTEAFVRAAGELPKLCPQFHLALQSGSDTVLQRMRRRYNTAQYRAAAQRLLAAFPDASFTTDVIVGFPGETEAEFAQTTAFCREIGFLKLHVFPFSPREGTEAAQMDGQVPEAVKAERVRRLIAVGQELSAAYRAKLLGTVKPVLLEERGADGAWNGYTPQYVHVACKGGGAGRIVPVRLTALTGAGMAGEPVETML